MSEPLQSAPLAVLALDDDQAQRHVLAAALHQIATVSFHSTPADVVAAARSQAYDVAILDVHLRRSREDGFDVARQLQQADPDLAVAVYTGDDSSVVLENALDVRALRRVLKGAGKQAIIAAVQECAAETALRRQRNHEAALGRDAHAHLAQQVQTVELTRTIADVYRGFFHELATELTSLGMTAAAFDELASRLAHTPGDSRSVKTVGENLARIAGANARVVSRLGHAVRQMASDAGELTDFENRAPIMAALQSLERLLAADVRLFGRLKILAPLQEIVLPTSPVALLNVLRNTALHLLAACGEQPTLEVRASTLTRGEAESVIAATPSLLVLNRAQLRAPTYLRFSFSSAGARIALESLRAALAGPQQAGPLFIVANFAALLGGTVVFQQGARGATAELFFPTW